MPAVDQNTGPRRVRVTAKAKPPRQADQGDRTRGHAVQETGKVRMYAHPARPAAQKVFRQQAKDAATSKRQEKTDKKRIARMKVTPVASPDATDSTRSPAQVEHDKQYTAEVVRESRVKALRKKNRGSGARAVKSFLKDVAKADLTTTANTGAGPTVHVISRGKGGGAGFAAIEPVSRNVNLDDSTAAGNFTRNIASDAGELLVTTPSSVAHLAGQQAGAAKALVTGHPKRAGEKQVELGKELVKPYVDLAKHPVHSFTEHPVSTALMVAPTVRVPGRVAGKVMRATGKQTLERPAATLPGTALEEARIGSRDAVVRHVQAKNDAKNPAPTVTEKQVQRRVDEHYDASKQHTHRTVGEAVNQAKDATKGQPKPVQDAAIEAAREHAQQVAKDVAEERFAREFGANVRLSHGVAAREATHTVRRRAVKVLDAAKATAKQAEAAHGAAWDALRAARNAARSSPQLRALEFRLRDSQRDLVGAQSAAAAARLAHSKAVGRAQVLTQNVTGRSTPTPGKGWAGGGHGVNLAKAQVDATAKVVTDTRARIKDLEQKIADEHARPLPPLHPARQAFTDAIQARGQARAALATARADAHVAAHAHIAAKKAMTNATLVSPAGAGRLFAHKADAATVVKKLNETATPIARGKHFRFTVHDDKRVAFEHQTASTAEPVKFVVRQVGPDRWAAVPQIAAERLAKHHAVGSSPATMAKVMKTSRGMFTNAVLPLSAKWLAGQGIESGVRAAVAGAGPMDWLRVGKVVKELNKKKPGAGDELATRISGGQFGLTGPARDFAEGKSLAAEFDGTPLGQPAAAVTFAGQAPPLRAVRSGWKQYTRVVLDGINHLIESNARRAMAGQAIKNLGFQDLHLNGLSEKAIEDAAKGLEGTHNQVALARAVDRMYGRYQKFSPDMRSLLLHWSPFLPWYLNTVQFLFKTLPVDHPIKSSLLAAANQTTEDWRKEHGLSLHDAHVPNFMLGSVPTKDGKYLGLAHYTPWGIGADPVGASADLALPQFMGPIKNMGGVDWKWQRETHGGKHGPEFNWGEKLARAGVTALEEQVPGVAQLGKISGVTPRFIDKDNPEDIKSPGTVVKGYLPWTPMSGAQPSSTSTIATPVRVRPPRPPRPPRPARPARPHR